MGYENESTGVGFVPQRLTAKVTSLKLNLRNKLNERYKRIRLRFRAEYIPLPEAPNVGSMGTPLLLLGKRLAPRTELSR